MHKRIEELELKINELKDIFDLKASLIVAIQLEQEKMKLEKAVDLLKSIGMKPGGVGPDTV